MELQLAYPDGTEAALGYSDTSITPVLTYTFEGETHEPKTVIEWVTAVLQKSRMRIVSCSPRMVDAKLETEVTGTLSMNIDVAINDTDTIAAIGPTKESYTREMASEHVRFRQCAVINIRYGSYSNITQLMPLETEDERTNAYRILQSIAQYMVAKSLPLSPWLENTLKLPTS